MHRKHYLAFAKIIRDYARTTYNFPEEMVEELVQYFESENKGFNRKKFYKECKLDDPQDRKEFDE